MPALFKHVTRQMKRAEKNLAPTLDSEDDDDDSDSSGSEQEEGDDDDDLSVEAGDDVGSGWDGEESEDEASGSEKEGGITGAGAKKKRIREEDTGDKASKKRKREGEVAGGGSSFELPKQPPPDGMPTLLGALEEPLVEDPEQSDNATRKLCVICPGKTLKTQKMIETHMTSGGHERRLKRFKEYITSGEADFLHPDPREVARHIDTLVEDKLQKPEGSRRQAKKEARKLKRKSKRRKRTKGEDSTEQKREPDQGAKEEEEQKRSGAGPNETKPEPPLPLGAASKKVKGAKKSKDTPADNAKAPSNKGTKTEKKRPKAQDTSLTSPPS